MEEMQKIPVCGLVGAGKSSLLYVVLREIPKISGIADVLGSIAYISQTFWIQRGASPISQDLLRYGYLTIIHD